MKKALTGALVVVAMAGAAGGCNVRRGAGAKSEQPCWQDLLSIEAAKEQWALETQAPVGSPVTVSNILPYLSAVPTCHVAGAKYIVGKVGKEPGCTTHGTLSAFRSDRY